MPFKSYFITTLPNGTERLTQPQPIRFSGSIGLVARHLNDIKPAESARWSLEESEWLDLAGQPPSDSRWIVFEQIENDRLCLSRVNRINGMVCGGQTELLVMMSPLTVLTSEPTVVVAVPNGGRAWSEELALDGAPGRSGATWSWCERTLHVGSAVFGSR